MNHNTFQHIKHIPLRTFNQHVYFFNLLKDEGQESARAYAEMLTQSERNMMYIMNIAIKKLGEKEVRRQVTEGQEFPYEVRYENWEEQVEAYRAQK